MSFIRNGIFTVVVLCIQAVFCAGDSTHVYGNVTSNFNALDELSLTANQTTQVIREIIAPVEAPQENMYIIIERDKVLARMQNKIGELKQENERLEATKHSLKEKCDGMLSELTESYNKIVSSLKLDVPEMQLWEKRLQTSMLTRELIIKALTETKIFVGFLELKKMVLIGDIGLLGSRENEYSACQGYRRLWTLEKRVEATSPPPQPQPQEDDGQGQVETRSGPIGLRSLSAADVSKTLFERNRVLLDVELEKQSHMNRELKKSIEYYSGYCSRSIESVKIRIGLLRQYPAGDHSLEHLKGEVMVIETEAVVKKSQLGRLKEALQKLVAEVRELQERYDALREPADCFLELARFHVDGAASLLTQEIVAAEKHTYHLEDMIEKEPSDFQTTTLDSSDHAVTITPSGVIHVISPEQVTGVSSEADAQVPGGSPPGVIHVVAPEQVTGVSSEADAQVPGESPPGVIHVVAPEQVTGVSPEADATPGESTPGPGPAHHMAPVVYPRLPVYPKRYLPPLNYHHYSGYK